MQDGASRRVRIDVAQHVHAFGAGPFQPGQGTQCGAPGVPSRGLVVGDLQGRAGAHRDLQGLLQGGLHLRHLVAQMGDVGLAVTGGDPGQRDDLLGVGVGAGRVDQPGRQTGRPLGQRPVQQRAHGVQFVGPGRPGLEAHHSGAQCAVADQRGDMGVAQGRVLSGGERVEVHGGPHRPEPERHPEMLGEFR